MRVAVLGTGAMGVGMARSLLRDGFGVTAWNRTPDRARLLAGDGATVADSARDAVAGADLVVTMLFDADAVLDVLDQVSGAVGPAAVVAQMSTIGLNGTRRLARLADRTGLRVLDAPVLGTRQPAADGRLVVLASGDPALRPAAQPAFDAMGAKTVWAGDGLGAGSALKLACNAWVATITAGIAQSLALAEALGLDPQLFLDAIAGGQSDTPYAALKGGSMLRGEFPSQFALDGVLKDLGLIRSAVESSGVDPALAGALHDVYRRASDAGHGGEDLAAVVSTFRASDRPQAGLAPDRPQAGPRS